MSEKEQQFERIYEKTKDFGRTQFVREIQMQINDNKKKDEIIKQLKKQKDDVVEGLKDLKQFVYDELVDFNVIGATETHCKVMNLLRMLGEIDE